MTERLRIVVTGLIAQYPLGGVSWDYLQYPLGLSRLGHDVYYFEDTGQWPYDPHAGGLASDPHFNVGYLAKVMARIGLEDRWAYRFPWRSQWFGISEAKRIDILSSADLLINVSGTLGRLHDYRRVRRLVYIDTDPVFTQIKIAQGQIDFANLVNAHHLHFSFGEALPGNVPTTGHHWRSTRQPIVLSEWQGSNHCRPVFTTVMNWTSYKPLVYEGRSYGQKDVEFKRFLDLPQKASPIVFEIAVNAGKTKRTPYNLLKYRGWSVVAPEKECSDLDSYRSYVQSSRGEWSIAKNGYVVGQVGWFSCRSACYLAAGRPVVVQDTGFGKALPVGQGILPFCTMDEAVAAIHEVENDYRRHSAAAVAVAEAYFDSDRVLTRLIEAPLSDDSAE